MTSAGTTLRNTRELPDERGRFGEFGGRYVAETLMPLVLDLERAYRAAQKDPAYQAELDVFLRDYVGRPSPLYFAERLTEHYGNRENLFQTRRAQSPPARTRSITVSAR